MLCSKLADSSAPQQKISVCWLQILFFYELLHLIKSQIFPLCVATVVERKSIYQLTSVQIACCSILTWSVLQAQNMYSDGGEASLLSEYNDTWGGFPHPQRVCDWENLVIFFCLTCWLKEKQKQTNNPCMASLSKVPCNWWMKIPIIYNLCIIIYFILCHGFTQTKCINICMSANKPPKLYYNSWSVGGYAYPHWLASHPFLFKNI